MNHRERKEHRAVQPEADFESTTWVFSDEGFRCLEHSGQRLSADNIEEYIGIQGEKLKECKHAPAFVYVPKWLLQAMNAD